MDVVKEFILCFQISRGKETEGEPDRPPRRLPGAGEHQAEARPRGVQVSQLQAYDRERHSQTENGKERWVFYQITFLVIVYNIACNAT